jgi:hypothetical protein
MCTRHLREPVGWARHLGRGAPPVPPLISLGLLYRIEPHTIRILAVMNLRRRPACWVGREQRATSGPTTRSICQRAVSAESIHAGCSPTAGELGDRRRFDGHND